MLRPQVGHGDFLQGILDFAELDTSYRTVFILFIYSHSVIEILATFPLWAECYSILIEVDLQSKCLLFNEEVRMLQDTHYRFEQPIDLALLHFLGLGQGILKAISVLLFDGERFLLYGTQELGTFDCGVELGDNFLNQLLPFELIAVAADVGLSLEFFMEFDFAEIIFEENDFDFLVLNLFDEL